MASSIAEALIPSASRDVVAIFPEAPTVTVPAFGEGLPIGNSSGLIDIPGFIPVQAFPSARITNVSVREPSEFMRQPLSDQTTVIDHRIILPVEIDLTVVLEPESYRNVYLLIRQAYLNAIKFSVQTRVNTYTSMYLRGIPHDEDAELFDTVGMTLSFIEGQIFSTSSPRFTFSDVLVDSDSSLLERGQQQLQTATEAIQNQGSTLFRAFGDLF